MAGCTAIVAFIVGKKLFVANAGIIILESPMEIYLCNIIILLFALKGDSRGVLCRKNGVAYPLSEDHKPQQV